MIILPEKRILLASQTRSVRGRYKIEIAGPDGRRRIAADWFKNLITNGGMDQLGLSSSGGNFFNICAVGSGNATPAFTDTALQTLVGSTSTQQGSTYTAAATSPYFGTSTIVFDFPAGTATGNLSEVGIGPFTTTLFSRALILDGSGNPTTITVLSSESLFVTYQLEQFVPLTDVTGTITIAAVSYSYTLRAANATQSNQWAARASDGGGLLTVASACAAFNGTIGAITGQPSGTSSANSGVSNNAYSSGSFTNSGTATWGLGAGNLSGGISAVTVFFGPSNASRGQYQISFSPAIPKDSSHILTLSFSTTWARV